MMRYQFFEPINYIKFLTHFQIEDSPDHQRIFCEWLNSFSHKAINYYRWQYYFHRSELDKAFRKQYQLPTDATFYDYDLSYEWEEYCMENGLSDHRNDYEIQIEIDKRRQSDSRIMESVRFKDIFREMMRSIALAYGLHSVLIDELWFNTTIQNSTARQKKLQSLSYTEYLKTDHWEKVRAAQNLIHRAICQYGDCVFCRESYYEIDASIGTHVHHISYDNRGNERYEDLTVVCPRHHRLLHEKDSRDYILFDNIDMLKCARESRIAG